MLTRLALARVTVCFAILLILLGVFAGELAAKKRKFKVTYPDGRSEEYEYDDKTCDLIGWRKKVRLGFSLKTIRQFQGSFAFTSEKIRKLDDLQKDFALQYQILCRDHQRGVYAGERIKLYDCLMGNVSEALIALRSLKLTLETVKDARSAETVRIEVVELVDKVLNELVPNRFRGGCVGQHLFLGRDYVEITAGEAAKSVPVKNGGMYPIKWWPKTNMPQIFLDPSEGGQLNPGAGTKLIVIRSALHGGSLVEGEIVVQDDLQEQVRCSVRLVPAERRIEGALDKLKGKAGQEAIEVARSVAADLAPNASGSAHELVAGELLIINGNYKEAWDTLDMLHETDPGISGHPEFQLAWGVGAYKIGQKDLAMDAFRSATVGEHAALAAGYVAHTLTAEGKLDQAQPYIAYFESDPRVSRDSWIGRTLRAIFNVLLPDAEKPPGAPKGP